MPLFLITAKDELLIYTTEKQPIPKPGHKLVSLAPPLDLTGRPSNSNKNESQAESEPETREKAKLEE